ncbi:MAG: acyl carrier protein [Burkholderiales bacterium]|nr:acyl carrier protein [Burkholderiales bacterium]
MALRERDIYEVVREFMRDHGRDPATITPEANLRDVGIDSLGAVELAFRFEDRFGVSIPMEAFPLTTIGDAVRFVTTLADLPGAPAD